VTFALFRKLFIDCWCEHMRLFKFIYSHCHPWFIPVVSFLHYHKTGLFIQITWRTVRVGEYARNYSLVNNLWLFSGQSLIKINSLSNLSTRESWTESWNAVNYKYNRVTQETSLQTRTRTRSNSGSLDTGSVSGLICDWDWCTLQWTTHLPCYPAVMSVCDYRWV